jgi:hypothetical protein
MVSKGTWMHLVLDLQDAAAGWGRTREQYGPDDPETLSCADILTAARESLVAALWAEGLAPDAESWRRPGKARA